MTRECIYFCNSALCILYKFPNSRSEQPCTDQCGNTAYHMYCTGTCKIMEPDL